MRIDPLAIPLTRDQRKLEFARLGLPAAYTACTHNCAVYEDCPIWRAIDATAKPYDCEYWPNGLPAVPPFVPAETPPIEPASTAPRDYDLGGLVALAMVVLILAYYGWHIGAAVAEGRLRW